MSSRRVYAPNSNDEDVVPVSTNIDEAHTESADRVRAIGEAALAVASRRINARGKRAIDLIIGAAALAFVLPLIASLIVLLRLDGRGPAIVGTQKIGRRGRPFTQFFFRRSRFGDGEANVPGEGPGLIARLPGLWNVVTGDLSLVGAPAVDRDGLDAYGQDRRFYLVARPGLTAPWGEEAVRSANLPALCRDYVLNWRLRRDLAVLWAAFSDRPRPRAR